MPYTIKAQTKQPFGINLLLAPPEQGNKDITSVQRFLEYTQLSVSYFLLISSLTYPNTDTYHFLPYRQK
jgi:hypothetical protein